MALDRDELAARLAAANLSNNGGDVVDPAKWAAHVVRLTDALLAALVPVAPASGAPPTEPRRTVGAVVRDENRCDWIVVGDGLTRNVERDIHAITLPLMSAETFVRWATREECERHGIPFVDRTPPTASPSPAAWVPRVGDKVEFDARYTENRSGVVVSIDAKEKVVGIVRFGEAPSKPVWQRYFSDVRFLGVANGIERINAGLPATSAERAAAGLPVDEGAVDRVALAKVLRAAFHKATYDGDADAWDQCSEVGKRGYLAEADAAIAFLKANGGAS